MRFCLDVLINSQCNPIFCCYYCFCLAVCVLAAIFLGTQTFYGFVFNDILYLSSSWPGPVKGKLCIRSGVAAD